MLPTHPGYNDLSRLNPRDPAEKDKIQLMIGHHLDTLNKVEQKMKSVAKHVAKLEASVKMLPKLMEMADNANDHAYVKLRVLTSSGGREVEVLSMTGDDSSGSRYVPGGSGRSPVQTEGR